MTADKPCVEIERWLINVVTMLSDRDYMRDQDDGVPWSMTTRIIVFMVAAFALQCVNDAYAGLPIERYLYLSPLGVLKGRLWQLLTYQCLHGGLLHIVFNLAAFWWVGRFSEQVMGAGRMVTALALTGTAGGVLQVFLGLVFPLQFGDPVVGASAGVCGLLAVFCVLQPQTVVQVCYVIPVRALDLFRALVAISLFFTLVPTWRGSGVAHAAHLGGLLAGWGWVKLGWHHDYVALPWEGLFQRLPAWWRRSSPKAVRRKASSGSWIVEPATPSKASSDFVANEVDPILDKIAAHGIHSLTEKERRILETARGRLGKR
jgi:membrane associated rhomboid family serine protease